MCSAQPNWVLPSQFRRGRELEQPAQRAPCGTPHACARSFKPVSEWPPIKEVVVDADVRFQNFSPEILKLLLNRRGAAASTDLLRRGSPRQRTAVDRPLGTNGKESIRTRAEGIMNSGTMIMRCGFSVGILPRGDYMPRRCRGRGGSLVRHNRGAAESSLGIAASTLISTRLPRIFTWKSLRPYETNSHRNSSPRSPVR